MESFLMICFSLCEMNKNGTILSLKKKNNKYAMQDASMQHLYLTCYHYLQTLIITSYIDILNTRMST